MTIKPQHILLATGAAFLFIKMRKKAGVGAIELDEYLNYYPDDWNEFLAKKRLRDFSVNVPPTNYYATGSFVDYTGIQFEIVRIDVAGKTWTYYVSPRGMVYSYNNTYDLMRETVFRLKDYTR